MMAWMIYVPEQEYINFYIFLAKYNLIDNVCFIKRFIPTGKFRKAYMFMGNFKTAFADRLERDSGIRCLCFGPSDCWRKALEIS